MGFLYSTDNKRYHTLAYHNRVTYGGRVMKASLDAGCTCPNRDGSLSRGGCIFCDRGSRYFSGAGPIPEQLEAERQRIRKKWPEARLIAYFQAGTNTYGDLTARKRDWESALQSPDVVGISIATRPDCLAEPVLEALTQLDRKTHLTVELGLQTVHDCTEIGKNCSFLDFLRGYEALSQRGIRVCVHLIDGLPGESREMMLESARQVGLLRPGGIKIHLLHVNEGTALAELWRRGRYVPMKKEQYVETVAEQLRYFPPETVMERLTGDGDRRVLLAPLWSRDKRSVLGAIDQILAKKDWMQGNVIKIVTLD